MSGQSAQDRPFEEALAELERTVRELEDGRLGLDQALARYEQGVSLIKQCYAQLRSAEQRISVLTGLNEDGTPTLQPFRHEATASGPGSVPAAQARQPSPGTPAPPRPDTTYRLGRRP